MKSYKKLRRPQTSFHCLYLNIKILSNLEPGGMKLVMKLLYFKKKIRIRFFVDFLFACLFLLKDENK